MENREEKPEKKKERRDLKLTVFAAAHYLYVCMCVYMEHRKTRSVHI